MATSDQNVSIEPGDLVALDVASSKDFVSALVRCWDAGAAVAPIDQRLSAAHKANAITHLGPTVVVTNERWQRHRRGVPVHADDRLVMMTSGTSGEPKSVVFTESGVQAAAEATTKAVGADPSRDRWLCCLPVAHMGGFGVVSRAIRTSTPLSVHDGFDAQAVTAAAKAGATLTALVPTALRRIDPRLFRLIVLGGSAIGPDKPPNATATYGLTESCGGVVYDGRPVEGVDMAIGTDDEILLKGPMMMRAYRSGDGSSPFTNDGWLRTGDRGEIVNGVLRVFGRIGDLIITGGENVWPAAVEAVLQAQPWVEAVVVVGRPDPEWGQVVTAIIEPAAGHPAPSLESVRQAVKAELPAFFAPHAIELRALPRTAIGKVRRHNLG